MGIITDSITVVVSTLSVLWMPFLGILGSISYETNQILFKPFKI